MRVKIFSYLWNIKTAQDKMNNTQQAQEQAFLAANAMYEACKKQVAQMVEWKLTGLRDEAKIANIKEQAQEMYEKLADKYADAVAKIYAI